MTNRVGLAIGEQIAAYGFGEDHPFGYDRHDVFVEALKRQGLLDGLQRTPIRQASDEELGSFHSAGYLAKVRELSKTGEGYLDLGDTPAFTGMYETAACVVGAVLEAARAIIDGEVDRGFVPIAGLHHASRTSASGFCVFNDCGVLIEQLHERWGYERIAYVDIDAHHGDGVYYGFADKPWLIFADLHEDGRYLYPGTGTETETGNGEGKGFKLNIPMAPGAGDPEFMAAWARVEEFLERQDPQFVILQCGADSLAGDPITDLRYSPAAHGHAAKRLCRFAGGKVLALGGGGYNRDNLAAGWSRVVKEFIAVA
ncbi:MAG: acetoin utilization protein AcuC [Gammaproteobacteria bacterium]|nr:acetoin utilization protein AcuC [Gammaproteobacteria bacterium]